MIRPLFRWGGALAFGLVFAAGLTDAQELEARQLEPNLGDNIARPLRYTPDGPDFVIANGAEYFNRPLYGGNTAFRVDAGDRPEFSLYLPGRGGNLRFGVRAGGAAKWLDAAAAVVARYRPGEMLYEIRDPVLGPGGVLRLTAVALDQTDGLIVRVEFVAGVADPGLSPTSPSPAAPVELVLAYGGVNGQRGRRDGDIGTEAVPISKYFQLQPEFCRDNRFELAGRTFTLHSRPATIVGSVPEGTRLAVADAAQWTSADALLASADLASGPSPRAAAPALPVIVGRVALTAGRPLFVALQRITEGEAAAAGELDTYRAVTAARAGADAAPGSYRLPPAYRADELPVVFAEAEAHFAALRGRVTVDTPDPYLNAAVGALNVAADAVWDGPQNLIMHGAIAWRTALLGWRGPYALDALGWHDRARRYLTYWAARQNTDPIPVQLPPADGNANLARSEAALHSNGDLSNSHYDMNLVYIDVLFRHLRWTGDLGLARQLWPVVERHLAWERRLFRREFGPDKLPLYEAYADIWASDDLAYGGGGVAYASAYNYYHNLMAARLARLLGEDPAPYAREAELIARALREYLWLPDRGMFAEFKDLLGRQLVHPSAGLWTFYHTIDSGVPTPQEAWAMTRYVDTHLPHLPVRGPGVPADDTYHVLATTDWMPYSWSVNNVVMGENVHAALAYWQAGRPGEAYRLLKSALLASMFMGICPGNVGTMDYLDVHRRESQRDFADGVGVLARAVVEGLFGVRPDLLAGELRVAPGFPPSWDHASLRHPDVSVAWRRAGETDTYAIESRFGKPLELRLELPARGIDATVTVDGQAAAWRWLEQAAPRPSIEIRCPLGIRTEIAVAWTGVSRLTESDVVGRGRRTAPPDGSAVGAQSRCAQSEVPSNLRAQQDCAPTDARMSEVGYDWRTPLPAATRWETVDLAPHFNDRVTNIFKREYRSPRSPWCSLAIPKQGLGGWAGEVNATAEIDDTGLRAVAAADRGRLVLPNGVPFATPGPGAAPNIVFTSQWDNFPRETTVPLGGRARHLYLLMAGSTNWMQSRLANGEVVVTYADGTTARLPLCNPTNWWPIEQDYFIDDYQFLRPEPIPPRVDLKSGLVRTPELPGFAGQGRRIPGGAATVLELPLNPQKDLQSLTVRALANEVVIGLMAATLER